MLQYVIVLNKERSYRHPSALSLLYKEYLCLVKLFRVYFWGKRRTTHDRKNNLKSHLAIYVRTNLGLWITTYENPNGAVSNNSMYRLVLYTGRIVLLAFNAKRIKEGHLLNV